MISEVFNIDCLEYMKTCKDKAFDLAIVDPPYGIDAANMTLGKGGGVAKSRNYKKKDWDKQPPSKEYWVELFRVSKNQIVWGGNYFSLPTTKGWIVWKKMDVDNDYTPFELAWTSFKKGRLFDFLWCGMWQQDMKNKEKRIHPTQKPVQLYKWVLHNYAKPGDKIFDSHLGSGSNRIAAYKMGFDFYGCELDQEHFEAQEKRFKQAIAQGVLL